MPKPTEKVVFADFAEIPKLAKWKLKEKDEEGKEKILTFDEVVREYRECNEMESFLKNRKKELGEALTVAMIASNQKRAGVDGAPVTLAKGKNTRIDAMLLLQEGVGSETINKCTVTKEYDYVTVGKVADAE